MTLTYQTYQITVADIVLQATRKPIKHLRIRVCPPDGRVKVSVPTGMGENFVRRAILSKLEWIRKHRFQMSGRPPRKPIQYVSGDTIRFHGRDCELNVVEQRGRPYVVLRGKERICLFVRPGSDADIRRKVMEDWYRKELKAAIPPLMNKWQRIMGVRISEWRIKRMKTRWGTCNVRARRIWINLELIKQSAHLLEFIIVHELTHLLEPSHNGRFKALMDVNMPDWRQRQKELKRAVLWTEWAVDSE
ncbi:MAG: metal-dependent hydrolase [Acidobacteria bacterium CG_4_9_14_3_um_filter_49_7]|nr:MAG: metal-dependent hydrolase [Acidobacteria bacterium CG_4_9_14_3_um_filter_49_7]